MYENPSHSQPVLKPVSPEKIESSIKSFTNYFFLAGAFGIIFSLIHLAGLLQNGYTHLKLYDFLINLAYGLCFLLCAYLLKNRKAILLYLYGGLLAVNVVTSILFGSWMNIIVLIIGIAIFIYLFTLKNQGVLK